MKKSLSILILFISIFSFAQTATKKQTLPLNTQIWIINAERAQCEGATTMQCLLVKKQGGKFFELFYDKIEGFDYVEGYVYTIWVKSEYVERKTSMIGDPETKYKLVKIVSKKSIYGKTVKTKEITKKEVITNAPKPQTTTLIINEEKAKCEGNPDAKCLLIKKPNSNSFEIFYQGIRGFTFEEGYRQTILVNERQVENPMVKQVEPVYTLLEVLKKELIFTPKKVEEIPVAQKSILDRKWILRKMKDTDTTSTLIEDDGVYMELKSYENKLVGKAPCNTFIGGLNTDNISTIQIIAVANTRLYCENFMKFEELFFTLLQNAERFELVGGKLSLYKGNRLLLVFE